MRLQSLVSTFLLLVALTLCASAQTVTGTLNGTVTDTSGAVVPSVEVVAKSLETGITRTTRSNAEGFYNMPFLPLGSYDVTVGANGFKKIIKNGVLIELNRTTVSDFKLEISSIGDAVQITGETPQIETSTGELKHSLDEKRVEDTPLAGRNFISLVEQIPGFQISSFGGDASSGQNNPTNSSGSFAAFSGLGGRATTFQVDGVSNNDSSENQNRQGVNISTIKELQVLTNAFSAEFGGGGAAVLVQTKSGTNRFHGDGYDFIQNDVFNANGFFRNAAGNSSTTGLPLQPRPAVRRQQYGGTFGGPIWLPQKFFGPAAYDGRDRLFFFISAEKLFNKTGNNYTRVIFLPGEEPKACPVVNGVTVNPKPGDPLRTFCVDPLTHPNLERDLAFMRSVIRLYRTPELQGIAPNDPNACAQLISSGREPRCVTLGITTVQPRSDYTGRLDFRATRSDNLWLRYQYSRQRDTTGRFILGDTFGARNDRQYNLGLTETHVWSSRQVSEFRYSFGNRTTLQDVSDGNDIPVIRFNTNLCTGNNTGACGGIIGTSTNVPINRRQHDQQFVFNHTFSFARHTLKAGVDQRKQLLDDVSGDRSRGFWTFGTNDSTANIVARLGYTSFENFMRGFITTYQKGYGNPIGNNRFGETNLYLQDDFRLKRNLTLNLGVRYEYVRAPKEQDNRFSYGFEDDRNNVDPRFGFAYSPAFESGWLHKLTGGAGKSVIRGGYGINHTRLFQSLFSQNQLSIRTQPPNGYADVFSGRCPNEISDPACGFVFTPGFAITSTAFTAASANNTGAVRDIGGRLASTLLIPNKHLQMPYVQQWNLTLERQLPKNYAVQLSYSGNRGIGSPWFDSGNDAVFPFVSPSLLVDVGGGNFKPVVFDRACTGITDPICLNPANAADTAVGSLRSFSALNSTTATLAQKGIVIENGVPHGYISLAQPRTNERRPDATLGRFVNLNNFGWSYYHAATVKMTKRLSNGLSFNAFYTFSKAIDTGSEQTSTVVDTNAPASKKGGAAASLRGLSAYHAAHRMVASYSYELPFMRHQNGAAGRILGGWNITGVTTLQSGNPFSVTLGYDANGDGLAGDRPRVADLSVLGRSVDNGRRNAQGVQISTLQLPGTAFIPAQSAAIGQQDRLYLPGGGLDGQIGRNTFFLQGLNHTDMTAFKTFRVRESVKLIVRMEFYNVFNRVTFGAPTRTILSGNTLGTISTERNVSSYVNSGRLDGSSGRQGQIALRLVF
ncbi:MAG: TonB-dependent receptor [Acidobacteria bacterium]|nr:TonB-dependent receptor [Acidobacteriota bacterium]MBI3425900.1 TonB-dependent receptor [Acidobacteriota bacterium]